MQLAPARTGMNSNLTLEQATQKLHKYPSRLSREAKEDRAKLDEALDDWLEELEWGQMEARGRLEGEDHAARDDWRKVQELDDEAGRGSDLTPDQRRGVWYRLADRARFGPVPSARAPAPAPPRERKQEGDPKAPTVKIPEHVRAQIHEWLIEHQLMQGKTLQPDYDDPEVSEWTDHMAREANLPRASITNMIGKVRKGDRGRELMAEAAERRRLAKQLREALNPSYGDPNAGPLERRLYSQSPPLSSDSE